MAYVTQSILPALPAALSTSRYTRAHFGQAMARILASKPPVVGISISLSSEGIVEMIALAIPSVITVLEFSGPSGRNHQALCTTDLPSNLFKGISAASFDMAQIALHINLCTRQHIIGVDLSTLLSPSTGSPWRASKMARQVFAHGADEAGINQLWNGGMGDGFQSACLRAWISLKCVI